MNPLSLYWQAIPVTILKMCAHLLPLSSRHFNRNRQQLPEQEPASGSIKWQGEENRDGLMYDSRELEAIEEKQGWTGPAESLTRPGWLLVEEQRSGRLQPESGKS